MKSNIFILKSIFSIILFSALKVNAAPAGFQFEGQSAEKGLNDKNSVSHRQLINLEKEQGISYIYEKKSAEENFSTTANTCKVIVSLKDPQSKEYAISIQSNSKTTQGTFFADQGFQGKSRISTNKNCAGDIPFIKETQVIVALLEEGTPFYVQIKTKTYCANKPDRQFFVEESRCHFNAQ